MSSNYIDSHAHLTSPAVFDHVDVLLDRAKQAGVCKIVNICTNAETLEKGVALHQRVPWVFNTAATTPHDVDQEGDLVFPLVEAAAHAGNLVAIGETGLDYYYTHSKPETQKKFLIQYLHLALQCKLPVVIHCREAFADFFEILDAEYTQGGAHAPGVLHCFTGTIEEAKQVIERGWYLSLSGIVTFKKSVELHEVAKRVPLDQLLIETDTPYLAPQSHRGKSNEPSYIIETAAHIAALKGISSSEVAATTLSNAERLFALNGRS